MTLKHLQHEAHKVRMTPAEKAAMRARIFGAPAPVTSTASPYFFFDFQFMSRAFAAALVVLVVGGSGVAYAAEGALPGQPLYAVKIHVNEQVEVALATTPQQKVAVETRLAARRVAEAQTLEAQGRLDATTTQEIEDNFNEHASRALALAGGAPNAAMTSLMRAADTEDTNATASSSEVAEVPRVVATAAKVRAKVAAPTMMMTMSIEVHEDAATTTPPAQSEATSSEQAGEKHDSEDVSASIDAQRQILKEIRLRVESHHDGDNENRRGQDGSGDSNDDH